VRTSGFTPLATGRLRWLRSDEGGRTAPPAGPTYAATARLDPTLPVGDVSVVLRFAADPIPGGEAEAEIGFLAPHLVADRLEPGLRLSVMEGPKQVAEFVVAGIVGRVSEGS
jgi:hypothetical protein